MQLAHAERIQTPHDGQHLVVSHPGTDVEHDAPRPARAREVTNDAQLVGQVRQLERRFAEHEQDGAFRTRFRVPDADADKPLTVLLTWLYTDSTRRAGLVEYGYDAVTTPIKVMLDNPDIVSDSIRVWREIPLSIKREVKVEIGS